MQGQKQTELNTLNVMPAPPPKKNICNNTVARKLQTAPTLTLSIFMLGNSQNPNPAGDYTSSTFGCSQIKLIF